MAERILLVTDYDSTFSVEWEKNRLFAEKFMQKGNMLAFSTGRTHSEIMPTIIRDGLKYDYLSVNNGSTVYFGDEVIFNCVFDKKTLKGIIDFSLGSGNIIKLYNLTEIIAYNGVLFDDITKIKVICPDGETTDALTAGLKESFGAVANVNKARHSFLIEISPHNADKAKSAEAIALHAGIKKENVYAVGDSHSDECILEQFNGYAMEDCAECLKRFPSVKTVAELIEKIGDIKMIKSDELRRKFIDFFHSKEHTVIQGASLIPENDPSVLFTTAGMHPLVPYLLGQPHPEGTRLTDVQKCVRTGDIDEVGDASHLTFFEMLGNWSLGDYFKKEAISWSWEFLTSPEWLGLDKDRLYFTVFAGDEDSPRDTEAASYWMANGVKEDHIFYLPKENNWWWAGPTGPCGPDTEMFIDTGKPKCCDECSPACGCGKYLEIWNDVFMQYNRTSDGALHTLEKKNVDTGMGLERTIGVLQGVKSVYDTDLFAASLGKIAELSGKKYGEDEETTKAFRVIADHIRTATFILGDPKAVTPSNVDQGYVLRRLIRRAIRFANSLEMPENSILEISRVYINQYKEVYPELDKHSDFILEQLKLEGDRFTRTLKQGLKEFEKVASSLTAKGEAVVDGVTTFHLYDTFGFPPELTDEMAREKGFSVDMPGFEECFKEHQRKSSQGSEQRFKGGLAEQTVETARLHTATHLLHSALRKVLNDPDVAQKGSNITSERLRFDFTFGRKVTKEELEQVEALVNEAILADVEIICEQLPLEEAKKSGAIGLFESKYDSMVKVYTMGSFSKEICGGPHAARTGELGHFRIVKEESSSAGVRRIKAVLE